MELNIISQTKLYLALLQENLSYSDLFGQSAIANLKFAIQ